MSGYNAASCVPKRDSRSQQPLLPPNAMAPGAMQPALGSLAGLPGSTSSAKTERTDDARLCSAVSCPVKENLRVHSGNVHIVLTVSYLSDHLQHKHERMS